MPGDGLRERGDGRIGVVPRVAVTTGHGPGADTGDVRPGDAEGSTGKIRRFRLRQRARAAPTATGTGTT